MNASSMISFIQTSRKYKLVDSDIRQVTDVLGGADREGRGKNEDHQGAQETLEGDGMFLSWLWCWCSIHVD